MKKYIFIYMVLCASTISLNGQQGLKNGVYANIGQGFSGSNHTIHSFALGYQRSVSPNLYLFLEYNKIQGSQSFKSIFGESPQVDQFGQFGENYIVEPGEEDDIFGKVFQVRVLSIGIKKSIQMAPKFFIAGGLGANVNMVSELDIDGISYEDDGSVNYDESYPVYGKYSKIGAKVSLEGIYTVADVIALSVKAEYLSVASIIHFSLGATASF